MRKLFLYLLCGASILACKKNDSPSIQPPASLYTSPKSFPINLDKGYTYNVLNGDSISPIISSQKDTVVTGHNVLIKPRVLHLKPKVLSLTNQTSKTQLTHANVREVGKPVVHHIQGRQQSWANRQVSFTDAQKTNSPAHLFGKKQLMKFIPTTVAKPPHYRDNSRLNVQSFGSQQGLSSSLIYDIRSSKRGGMWLATYDGISYYDGTSFTDFTTNEGLPNGNVRAILEDKKGNVWFCPRQRGLCKYDGDTLTHFTKAAGLMSNHVFNIAEDAEGNVWWSSFRGLTKYDGQKATHYYLAEANYTKLYIGSNGSIWTASNKEIVKVDGENITSFDFTKMMAGSRVATIFEDQEGNMWFGLHRGGVLKYDGKSFLQYGKAQGLCGKSVYSIVQDYRGNIWLGTDKGLVKYSQNKFSTYTTKEGLSGDFIIKIMEDDQNNLWLGTYKSGLMKFNPNFFYQQYLQGEDNKDIVRSFHEDAQGVLWAITRNSGLLKITSDTVQTISLDNPDVGLIAYSLATDKQQNLWIGVKGGVIKYSAQECLFYPIISPDRYMTALSNDHDHNVWMETYQGIMKFNGKQFVEYPLSVPSSTTKIMVDTKGYIWVATGKGLYKITGNQAILYTPKEGLSSSVITSLLEDSHGNMWIGTYTGGLMFFNGKTFTYYTKKEGLSSNFIKSIVEDKQQNIWLGTEKGLSLMQPQFNPSQQGKQSYTIINYGHEDGLESINFEPRAAILDKTHKLWWGTGKKVVSLDLNTFQVSQKKPQVHLRQLDINGAFVNFRLLPDSLKSAITFSGTPAFENYPLNLTLDHNHRHIKLHFSALSNEVSKKIKYSYRIKDQGKLWSQPAEQPFVEYQNLPFGTHTFQVKAIGDAQVWSKVMEYTFVVKPPLWQSKGFILLYVVSCITMMVVYIRWNLARLVKKQQLLEQKVADRTLNLNEAIDQLNQLNLDLKSSKAEVIQLKEKEEKIFTDQIKQREDEMLLIMKTINERLYKANAIKDELFVAIKKRSDQCMLAAAKDLAKFLESISDLDILTERIEEKYPGMLMKIKIAYPELSANDVKHCLYIRLNLTLKEVAQLHNVSISAVKTARNRLRRKMAIPKDTPLKCFIQSKF